MKILIIDDEYLHLEGLYHIITTQYENAQVQCAGSADEALGILDDFPADIILTDIEMPVLSGIDLIRQIRSRNLAGKIIIISAHDKFLYAQQAVELGVTSYLLKPFSQDQIASAIEKALEQLHRENASADKDLIMRRQLDNTMPVYLEHLVQKLAVEASSDEDRGFLSYVFDLDCPTVIFLSRFDRPMTEELRYDYPLALRQHLKPIGKGFSFPLPDAGFCTILQLLPDQALESVALRVLLESFSYDSAALSIDISKVYPVFPENLPEVLNVLKKLREYHFYRTSTRVMEVKDMLPFVQTPFLPAGNYVRLLLQAVRQGKEREAFALLQESFRFPDKSSFPSRELYLEQLVKLMRELFDILLKLHSDQDLTAYVNAFNTRLRYSLSLTAAADTCRSGLNWLFEQIRKASHSDHLSVMADCIHYLQSHYMEDLSLEILASRYYFNPSYFSSLFHACTGKGFAEYLMKYRLERSTELLLCTGKKIYQIASEVGYTDSTYYNRIFKREYGVSPDKYRKLRVTTHEI